MLHAGPVTGQTPTSRAVVQRSGSESGGGETGGGDTGGGVTGGKEMGGGETGAAPAGGGNSGAFCIGGGQSSCCAAEGSNHSVLSRVLPRPCEYGDPQRCHRQRETPVMEKRRRNRHCRQVVPRRDGRKYRHRRGCWDDPRAGC